MVGPAELVAAFEARRRRIEAAFDAIETTQRRLAAEIAATAAEFAARAATLATLRPISR